MLTTNMLAAAGSDLVRDSDRNCLPQTSRTSCGGITLNAGRVMTCFTGPLQIVSHGICVWSLYNAARGVTPALQHIQLSCCGPQVGFLTAKGLPLQWWVLMSLGKSQEPWRCYGWPAILHQGDPTLTVQYLRTIMAVATWSRAVLLLCWWLGSPGFWHWSVLGLKVLPPLPLAGGKPHEVLWFDLLWF